MTKLALFCIFFIFSCSLQDNKKDNKPISSNKKHSCDNKVKEQKIFRAYEKGKEIEIGSIEAGDCFIRIYKVRWVKSLNVRLFGPHDRFKDLDIVITLNDKTVILKDSKYFMIFHKNDNMKSFKTNNGVEISVTLGDGMVAISNPFYKSNFTVLVSYKERLKKLSKKKK